MKAENFIQKLTSSLKNRKDTLTQKFPLSYEKGEFELLRISSKKISAKDKIMMITAGFHGDEKAGPLSILKYANKIIDYAHKKRVKIIIYPLVNPSGFEKNKRCNIDNDFGDASSDDFLRYELENGKIIDDLAGENNFKKWYWSSDKKIKSRMPKETWLLHKLLKKEPLNQIAAAIDLHQDHISNLKTPFAYHYSFENKKVYEKIIKKISKIIPILKNRRISAGFTSAIGLKADKKGFIIRHDGTITDLFYRLGTKYAVAVETAGPTSFKKAISINLIWIFGIINLIAK